MIGCTDVRNVHRTVHVLKENRFLFHNTARYCEYTGTLVRLEVWYKMVLSDGTEFWAYTQSPSKWDLSQGIYCKYYYLSWTRLSYERAVGVNFYIWLRGGGVLTADEWFEYERSNLLYSPWFQLQGIVRVWESIACVLKPSLSLFPELYLLQEQGESIMVQAGSPENLHQEPDLRRCRSWQSTGCQS